MFLNAAGTAMMSIDRGQGQFAAEIRSHLHWWPIFMVRVGKGTSRVDAVAYIKDGVNVTRWPTSYATWPDGGYYDHTSPDSVNAARASLAQEAERQRFLVQENMHMLIRAMDDAYRKKGDLILVRKVHDPGVTLFEPQDRLPGCSNAKIKKFLARSAEASRTGMSLVTACTETGPAAYAKIKPSDLLVMRMFLEAALLFRDMK